MERTYVSGYAKRVERSKREKISSQNVPPLTTFFGRDVPILSGACGGDTISSESENENVTGQSPDTSNATNITAKKPTEDVENNVEDIDIIVGAKDIDIPFRNVSPFPSHRGLYSETVGDEQLKDLLTKQVPCQPTEDQFSFNMDARGRKFSSTRNFVTTPMGVKVKLNWLSYSPTLEAVYCHSCWLFGDRNSQHFRLEWINGISDWAHMSQKIKSHQDSSCHHCSIVAEKMYSDEKTRLDKELVKECAIEANFWYQVMRRIVDIVFTLALENLAFRGHREVREDVDIVGCGNFLALVKLIGRYDPLMKKVLAKRKGSIRYLSPTIQNKLISLGNSLRQHLMDEIQSPFLTVIGDSTKDIAKVEQFSNYYRYVHFDPETNMVSVRETFLGFIPEKNKSSEGVADMILNNIKEAELDISKCRGQGYRIQRCQ